jgi:hypothetical protein
MVVPKKAIKLFGDDHSKVCPRRIKRQTATNEAYSTRRFEGGLRVETASSLY